MFQCTVASQHDLKAGILRPWSNLTAVPTQLFMWWCGAQSPFNAWTHGMEVPTLPDSPSDKVKQHRNNLKQYVTVLESIKSAP